MIKLNPRWVNLSIAVMLTLFAIVQLANSNYIAVFINVLLATINLWVSTWTKE